MCFNAFIVGPLTKNWKKTAPACQPKNWWLQLAFSDSFDKPPGRSEV
jgi:hypothetical protein